MYARTVWGKYFQRKLLYSSFFRGHSPNASTSNSTTTTTNNVYAYRRVCMCVCMCVYGWRGREISETGAEKQIIELKHDMH